MVAVRKRVAEILEPGTIRDRTSWYVDIFFVVLILLNVVDVVLESVGSIYGRYHVQMLWFERFSVLVFTVEYLLRIWSCVDVNPQDQRPAWRQRASYFVSPMAIVDLLAILPYYLSLFFTLDLRFLRVIRVLRIFKLTRYSMAMQLLLTVFWKERRSFVAAFSILFTLLILTACGIYLIEQQVQPDKFGSIPAAMWWAMATLTTVGYGDVTPVTPAGKFFGGLITIIGIGMVALPAGILASGFNLQMDRRRQKFNILIKEVLMDGIVTDQELIDLETLRKELDLDKEEAEMLFKLSETRKQGARECPHCGGSLHALRRADDA